MERLIDAALDWVDDGPGFGFLRFGALVFSLAVLFIATAGLLVVAATWVHWSIPVVAVLLFPTIVARSIWKHGRE